MAIGGQRLRRTACFILSSDYSGSTWVGYVLGSNSQAAFLGEFYRGWRRDLAQPCAICQSRGLTECAVLHGFQQVQECEAFAWAFERIGKRVIVDSSKVLEWPLSAMRSLVDPDARFIHLLRDPRGWLASQMRRQQNLDVALCLDRWVVENRRIRSFVEGSGFPYITAFYDDLAKKPESSFRTLTSLIGMPFELKSLRYWECEHHGFAANGSTSMLFVADPDEVKVEAFSTADNPFYRSRRHTSFIDERWKDDLSSHSMSAVHAHLGLRQELDIYGRDLSQSIA